MQPKSVLVPPDSQTWKLGNRYTRKDLKTVWDLSEGVWVPRTRNEKSLFLYILRAPLWKSWRKRVRVKTSGPLAAAAAPQPPPLPENSASLPVAAPEILFAQDCYSLEHCLLGLLLPGILLLGLLGPGILWLGLLLGQQPPGILHVPPTICVPANPTFFLWTQMRSTI